MFYSDLKPNLFHKIILTTGSHSLIIDLSNDVFFHIFYCHLKKYGRLKRSTSDQTPERGAVKSK